MNGEIILSDLDLAALLCSRVCHDVISPVGAITNGLELLEVEDDESMREMAMDLVKKSAKQASAKIAVLPHRLRGRRFGGIDDRHGRGGRCGARLRR